MHSTIASQKIKAERVKKAQSSQMDFEHLRNVPIPRQISPTDIIIPVMGITGSGKSTFISLCTDEKVEVDHGLRSCTAEVQMYSFRFKGHIVRLIDTPGFDDTERPDSEILTDIANWLSIAYKAQPQLLLSGIIYLHPIHEPKLQGSAKKNLKMFELLCGKSCFRSVVLATTMWSRVSVEDGWHRQEELMTTERFWGHMLQHGSQVFKHDNNQSSAFRIVDHIICNRMSIILDIQRQMVEMGLNVDETAAGRELRASILKEKAKAEQRLERSERNFQNSLNAENAELTDQLLQEQERFKAQIQEKEASLDAMKVNMDQLREQKEAAAKDSEEKMRKAREDNTNSLTELNKRLSDMKVSYDAKVKESEQQRKDLDAAAERRRERREQRGQAQDQEFANAVAAERVRIQEAAVLDMRLAQLSQQMANLQAEGQRRARQESAMRARQAAQEEERELMYAAGTGFSVGSGLGYAGAMALGCSVM